MWWLLRADLNNRSAETAYQMGTYPDSSTVWAKVDIGDSQSSSTSSKSNSNPTHNRFLLKEIKKPNTTPLRLPLKPLHHAPNKSRKEQQTGFPVPPSWKGLDTPQQADQKKNILTIQVPLKQDVFKDNELSLEEKLKILKEQEGYTPRKRKPCKTLNPDENRPSEAERQLCNWISVEIKPLIGRLEGCRRSASSIGKKLNTRSRALRLWHEEFSPSARRSAKGILLHDILPSSMNDPKRISAENNLCKRICHLMRVNLPSELRASPRISPEEQVNEIEKGGHGSSRDKLADYNMLVESFRRQKDAGLHKEEARMLLCKGILHDNAQEYRKAMESYQEYLILCIKNGDKEGEATAYNFMGCSVQEEQDLKLVKERARSNDCRPFMEISSAAAIQYEKAEEYHKMHADIANWEGKFIAQTNLGLLYADLGKWSEAALSHQIALKCATLMERPDQQGVAVGNLGITLFRQKEWVTAKACMAKYLHISIALKNAHGQAHAHYILGSIASRQKRYEEAVEEFRAALKVSRLAKDKHMEALSRVMLGVAQGENKFAKIKDVNGEPINTSPFQENKIAKAHP